VSPGYFHCAPHETLPRDFKKDYGGSQAQLLEEYRLIQKVRLVGVGSSGFKSSGIPVQLDLFDRRSESDSSWTKIDQTLETITNKFGKDAIKRATLSEK
jgi:hypothetical protein